MHNIFMEEELHHIFSWDKLGNIKEGRGDLGEDMPVLVYRLLEYSMNHVLAKEFGVEKANDLFRKTGKLAGSEFAKNVLDLNQDLNSFFAQLQRVLRELKIGVLRVESVREEDNTIIITVAEDLDCSGLPPTNEVVCNYDEGFIAGILETYTHKPYLVREVDCWASGDRVCRFKCQTGKDNG
ncbi:MAG: 4-vinyl reductase [Erysipelotrichaceae bacterium]|nr:4-vinyl reductase [Erysipelotrichaceae bacterium]